MFDSKFRLVCAVSLAAAAVLWAGFTFGPKLLGKPADPAPEPEVTLSAEPTPEPAVPAAEIPEDALLYRGPNTEDPPEPEPEPVTQEPEPQPEPEPEPVEPPAPVEPEPITIEPAPEPVPPEPQPEPEPEPVEPPVPVEPEPAPAPEPKPYVTTVVEGGITYDYTEADGMMFGGSSPEWQTGSINAYKLITDSYHFDFPASDGPQVLLYHTHTSEAYTKSEGYDYKSTEAYRTLDTERSIVRVGDEIAAVLESHGIRVVHDTTFNDYPNYDDSYDNALPKIEKWLEEYPSIQLTIDVHRDACLYNGEQLAYRKTVNGEQTAQVLLVCGDGGKYGYEGWKDNLSWNLKLYAQLNRDAPGLARILRVDHARYNLHLRPGSMLLEVGAAGNTLPEAITAARIFAESLSSMILSLMK